jgi:hypothetical protein
MRNFKLLFPHKVHSMIDDDQGQRCIVKQDQIPFPTNNFSFFDFKLEKVEWRKDK